jgi:hypothetical protein
MIQVKTPLFFERSARYRGDFSVNVLLNLVCSVGNYCDSVASKAMTKPNVAHGTVGMAVIYSECEQ